MSEHADRVRQVRLEFGIGLGEAKDIVDSEDMLAVIKNSSLDYEVREVLEKLIERVMRGGK